MNHVEKEFKNKTERKRCARIRNINNKNMNVDMSPISIPLWGISQRGR